MLRRLFTWRMNLYRLTVGVIVLRIGKRLSRSYRRCAIG
jgi:hypothetical protein